MNLSKKAYLDQLSNRLQRNRNDLKTVMDSSCCYWPSGVEINMKSPPREHRALWYCPDKYQKLQCEYSVTLHLPAYTNSRLFGARPYLVTRFGARILLCCSLLSAQGKEGCSITALFLHFMLNLCSWYESFKNTSCVFLTCAAL